jgi:hypothetical protein
VNPLPGSVFLRRTRGLSESARERAVVEALLAGEDPPALRPFVEVSLRETVGGASRTLLLRVAPDYLSIGRDDDFVRMPMYPSTAQQIADARRCILPTPLLVNAIHAQSSVKLSPTSKSGFPRRANATYAEHNRLIEMQRAGQPLGALTAGHKKDIVLSRDLQSKPGKVAIYGWHRPNGTPVQPLTTVHSARYADYSHGVRLVARDALLDGVPCDLADLLLDASLSALLSDEGPLRATRYPV